MPVCGPKLSLCGILLSIWGIVQLGIMGVLYHFHAVAFAEDLPGDHEAEVTNLEEFYSEVEKGYTQNAQNCWIAACLYLVTLAFSAHQFWANNRSSLRV
ncbi:ribonuclease kappa-B [Agrilus planipennis]|uniref:Ribonuclease kappa-B n=1 Tax=Agrilus planipennis TaxID=224129 RepID=A0A1W4WMP2_AGRPL|nr:ribonuclease kappa-B [Agrilus planipennis]